MSRRPKDSDAQELTVDHLKVNNVLPAGVTTKGSLSTLLVPQDLKTSHPHLALTLKCSLKPSTTAQTYISEEAITLEKWKIRLLLHPSRPLRDSCSNIGIMLEEEHDKLMKNMDEMAKNQYTVDLRGMEIVEVRREKENNVVLMN
jgi:hypothetical protein